MTWSCPPAGKRTFSFCVLQHHSEIHLANPFWLWEERVEVEPVASAKISLWGWIRRNAPEPAKGVPVLRAVQDEGELSARGHINENRMLV